MSSISWGPSAGMKACSNKLFANYVQLYPWANLHGGARAASWGVSKHMIRMCMLYLMIYIYTRYIAIFPYSIHEIPQIDQESKLQSNLCRIHVLEVNKSHFQKVLAKTTF